MKITKPCSVFIPSSGQRLRGKVMAFGRIEDDKLSYWTVVRGVIPNQVGNYQGVSSD